ncbi:MAG TPA: hypothetical protein VKA60_11690 [Blastocatellia bacterium]|nr:hypothetical protein [Blastocatellia bacterium]
MTTTGDKQWDHFDRAFELAYYIHVNKEIAFFIAEDALDELPLMLGSQDKNRQASKPSRGFWKWGERVRPVSKVTRLNEPQMLQWLVYKQSESWERQTELGNGLYLPTAEDLIVRYIEHLAFVTLRRGSFYVTLAVGPLLHHFDRRETRLLYDVLTQSDSARMKDMSYIGKQRLELLEKIRRRFDGMIRTVKKPGDEKLFVMRPTTPEVIALAHASLRHFTPWGTDCVVVSAFDVTYIPGLYFSEGQASDEDLVEMNRMHTLLHPECFERFIAGLCKYVRVLPDDHQDKGCDYDALDERLAVPEFANFPEGPPRGDRFPSPPLTKEDYVRLRRTLDARARRRKSFAPQEVRVYVDNELSQSFDVKQKRSVRLRIGPEAAVIEVRGKDEVGELTLATLLVSYDQIPQGSLFRDSVAHASGQKVILELLPARDAEGNVEGAQVEVSYRQPRLARLITRLRERQDENRDAFGQAAEPRRGWLVKAGVAALIIMILVLVWLQLRPRREVKPPEQAGPSSTEESVPRAPVPSPAPPESPPTAKNHTTFMARAAWSTDPQAALRATPIETTRGETKTLDLSGREQEVLVSLPIYNESGQAYYRYRVILLAAERPFWQQTLWAPPVRLAGPAHVLSLTLFPRRMPRKYPYDIRVEGRVKESWQPLGHVLLSPQP